MQYYTKKNILNIFIHLLCVIANCVRNFQREPMIEDIHVWIYLMCYQIKKFFLDDQFKNLIILMIFYLHD